MRLAVVMLLAGTASVAGQVQNTVARAASSDPEARHGFEVYGADWQRIEYAARRGLAWLAREQTEAGCWLGHVGYRRRDYHITKSIDELRADGRGHLGVTAIAGMAYLAGGHVPRRGEHGAVIEKAIGYVLEQVGENGYITDAGTRMYSHAFAALFLAEAHGMASRKGTKDGLERAVNWIVDNQNALGGWRYNPFTQQADLSVTVCQLQALRAARNIGIRVPKSTIDRATQYVMDSHVGNGRFDYSSSGRRRNRKLDSFAIQGAALTSLFSAGVYRPEVYEPTLDWLARKYENEFDRNPTDYSYWYGNYYVSQALFQIGGKRWTNYHVQLCRDLLATQQSDGSWLNDRGPGDVFATASACLLLQIPYQLLPIFQR